MSVWGGLIARDVMDVAAEGGREADDLAQVVGPLLVQYGVGMPADAPAFLEAARRYWVPCPATCRGAVLDLQGVVGVSGGGRGLVVVEDGVVSWSPWGRHLVGGAWLPPGVEALPELVIL